LNYFKAPQVPWHDEIYLAIHYQLIPFVICLTVFLSFLFFLHIVARTLSFYFIHAAQEDGREVVYVSGFTEKWSSETFRLASTVTAYSIVALALACIYTLVPYNGLSLAILKFFIELLWKSLQLLPDTFRNVFTRDFAKYVIGGVLGFLSYFIVFFPYQVSLYGMSRLIRAKFPGLSNIFRHLPHKHVNKNRGEFLSRIYFYFKDFVLRFSIMHILYVFLIASCLLLLSDVFTIHSVKLNLDKPIYVTSAPSEVSSKGHFDDMGVLTIYLAGLVNGDVRVKIIPEYRYSHYQPIYPDTYIKLNKTHSFFGSNIFGYRFCFPLRNLLLKYNDSNYIIDILVGRGIIKRNYLRFQESFTLIDHKLAFNLGEKDAAAEAVERGFDKLDYLINRSDSEKVQDLIEEFKSSPPN